MTDQLEAMQFDMMAMAEAAAALERIPTVQRRHAAFAWVAARIDDGLCQLEETERLQRIDARMAQEKDPGF